MSAKHNHYVDDNPPDWRGPTGDGIIAGDIVDVVPSRTAVSGSIAWNRRDVPLHCWHSVSTRSCPFVVDYVGVPRLRTGTTGLVLGGKQTGKGRSRVVMEMMLPDNSIVCVRSHYLKLKGEISTLTEECDTCEL